MSWRVVVINSRAKLELKLGYMVVRGIETRRILLDEISVLLIENTGCVVSMPLLCELWDRKIAVIFCDQKHNPGAQMIPLYGSYDSSLCVRNQIEWSKEIKDLIWAEIVKAKIRKQAEVIKRYKSEEIAAKLLEYSDDVLPGDITNREAHAAKVYFNIIFGGLFSRNEPSMINSALDYGYSVLLSVINREVVANGYLTQVGLFHHSVFNQFNLSSDLIEPFRPLVDAKVLALPLEEELSHEHKMKIVSILNDTVTIKGRRTTLLLAVSVYVKSVFDAIEAKNPGLIAFYET